MRGGERCKACRRVPAQTQPLVIRVRCDLFSSEKAEAVKLRSLPKPEMARIDRKVCGGYRKCDGCVFHAVEDRRGFQVRFFVA